MASTFAGLEIRNRAGALIGKPIPAANNDATSLIAVPKRREQFSQNVIPVAIPGQRVKQWLNVM